MLGVRDLQLGSWIQRGHNGLDDTFQAAVIAAAGQPQRPLLVRQFTVYGQIDAGRLEQFDGGVGQRFVHPPRFQQAGRQAAPQVIRTLEHGRAGHDRIGIRPGAEHVGPLAGHDAGRDRLVETGAHQGLPHLAQDTILVAAMGRRHGHAHILGDLIVAVDPRDFFHQVDFARHIPPPCGRSARDGFRVAAGLGTSQCREDASDFGRGNLDAQHAGQLRQSQHDRVALEDSLTDIDHAAGQLAASQLQDQLATATTGPIDSDGVDASLETKRRWAVQDQTAGRRTDREWREIGRFDQQISRRVGDFRLGAAHYPAQRDRLRRVGDYACPGSQLVRLVVDRFELLAGNGFADHNLLTRQLGEIKGVQRLPTLHHHIVRDVHDVVDRRRTDARQSINQPPRTGSDGHAADDAGRVPGTQFGALNRDFRQFGDRRTRLDRRWFSRS